MRKDAISSDLGGGVSRSSTVRLRIAIEVFQDQTCFPRLASLQQQGRALGEACCNEPWPAPAFPQSLDLTEQHGREVTLVPLFGDSNKDYVCA